MILKGIFSFFGIITKIIYKIIKYINWYFSKVSEIISDYPKKPKRINMKEEIL